MKLVLLLVTVCSLATSSSFSQLKEIPLSELTLGSELYFGAQMNNSTGTITVTFSGPADRYIALGFGVTSAMNGGDALIYSNATGSDAFNDHFTIGVVAPPLDSQQDWIIQNETVNGNVRTVVASRALNTDDADDFQFNFSDVSVPLFWAKGPNASTSLTIHSGDGRGFGIVRNWVDVLSTNSPEIVTYSWNESLFQLNQSITLNLLDLAGKVIATSENGSIDCSLFPSGIYVMNWKYKNLKIYVP